MSLYSQNYYGQPSYSTPGFGTSTVHSSYPYQYPQAPTPPPVPVYHVDPSTFRRDFSNRLNELTVNSRPIIQSLSMFAQEYSRFADVVAQCLDIHIRRVPPWMKLPAFYLLDAISKNVFEPYGRQFAGYVVSLFLDTYRQVDVDTRGKMDEMLLTWRTGSPSHTELFGVAAQVAIERGAWNQSSSGQGSSTFHSGSGQITKAQVLSELEYALGQKERALQINPYDGTTQNHLNVLNQLRKLVEAGVSQTELQQILGQLRTLVRSSAPPPPPPPAPPVQWQPPPMPQHHFPQQTHSSSTLYREQYPEPTQFIKAEVAPQNVTPNLTSQPPQSVAPPDIASLLSTLLKAGVVSSTGTPVGAGSTSKEESLEQSADLERESARLYRQSILSKTVKLTTSDITKQRPLIADLLYSQLPSQCGQCGLRFSDSTLGKKKQQDHLDMHFRQNRKASQNTGRGHSRSSFITAEDWIHELSTDVKGKGRADGHRPLNAKAAAAAESARRDAELRSLYVIVPSGDEAKSISCPICKETMKSEFLEEDEEWVWRNAIVKDDRVFHATCHSEASTNTLAARLRTEAMNRSRSGTPEASLPASTSRTTPPVVRTVGVKSASLSPSPESKHIGVKRKVEADDESLNDEADRTPPLKKIALSAPS